MRLFVVLFLGLILGTTQAGAASGETQLELNGFFLDQYPVCAKTKYKKLFHTGETPQTIWEAYRVNENTAMVFEVLKKRKDRIYAIEISGGPYSQMQPFLGLKLGDSVEKIYLQAGNPDEVVKVASSQKERLYYKQRNYSFEIDDKRRLRSIKIHASREKNQKPTNESYWSDFKNALQHKDYEKLLDMIRPDTEAYIDEKTFIIDSPFRELIYNEKSGLHKRLYTDRNNLAREISKHPSEVKMRRYENGTLSRVHKFPTSSWLEEIVFFPHYGKWKVYEIRLSRHKKRKERL